MSPARTVAGVDGCRGGWVAVILDRDRPGAPKVRTYARAADIVDDLPDTAILAVDMPIGLRDRTGPGGRGPERAVRPLLGMRQSSVFSVPSRAAVYADDYGEACRIARESSDPPRAVSKQCFFLFDKIRELDALLIQRPELIARVYETHPEVAFWRLNGKAAMAHPKKVKSALEKVGLRERQALLEALGLPASLFDSPRLPGVGTDDLLDAAANVLIACRIADGMAEPFPAPLEHDARGLPIAIWV
jgi:predicted RNase H-like nuclease